MTVHSDHTPEPAGQSPDRSHALVSGQARGPRIVDLSNSPEREPPPVIIQPVRVAGRLRIGHTADLLDASAPIFVLERAVPPGTAALDLRCPSCVAEVTLARGDAQTLIIIEHQHGCERLAELAGAA